MDDEYRVLFIGSYLHEVGPRGVAPVLGHELGHALAGHADAYYVGSSVLERYQSVAREITADRFGLLATDALRDAATLDMISAAGLVHDRLTWSVDEYIEDCVERMERLLAEGKTCRFDSHPEHGARVFALARFAETDVYRALSGKGPGSRSLADVDDELTQLIVSKLDLENLERRLIDRLPPVANLRESDHEPLEVPYEPLPSVQGLVDAASRAKAAVTKGSAAAARGLGTLATSLRRRVENDESRDEPDADDDVDAEIRAGFEELDRLRGRG